MIYLVTGASASGKSEYAESVAVKLYNECRNEIEIDCISQKDRDIGHGGLYYIATMKPFGEEAKKRILRHQRLRAGKGFDTIECYTHPEKLSADNGDVFLIECMSNLLANEIYDETGSLRNIAGDEEYTDRLRTSVAAPVLSLARNAAAVVIVTNDVFADGRHFDGDEAGTEQYCRMLGELNVMLAEEADVVVEVVCGMTNIIKGTLDCVESAKRGNEE